MNTDIKEIEKGTIKVDSEREFKTSRRGGVKNIFDAIVEILSNCGDSYYRIWRKNPTGTSPYGRVLIEFFRSEKEPFLKITDNAEGMDGASLKKNFINYRSRLSQKGDRSFMGKGAKDCTSLGSIEVESIYENKYNRIIVHHNGKYEIDKTKSANTQIRKSTRLKKNGTVFTLHINAHEKLPQFGSLQKNLPWHFGINKYIHENSNGSKVLLKNLNTDDNATDLVYKEPGDSEIVLDEKFTVESYSEAKAHLIIKKTKAPLEHAETPFMKHGIIIQSDTGTGSYERTIFDETLREEPLVYHYFGYLKTDYVSTLMEDFDYRILNDLKVDDKNPLLILDVNRVNGLDKNHPFTKKLFKFPTTKFKQIIAEEKAKLRKEQNQIENNDTDKLLKKLAKAFDDFIKDESDLDETDQGDNKDKFHEKGLYVSPPFLSMLKDDEKTIGIYIKEFKLKKDLYECEIKASSGKDSIEILESKKTFIKSDKGDGIYFFCKFNVRAISQFQNGLLQFFNGNNLLSSINFTIKEDLTRNFINDLEFERKKYKVKLNKRKIIRILAKCPDFIDKDIDFTVSNSSNDSVAIIGSNKFTLKKVDKSNYYAASINLEGRRLNSTATLKVEVLGLSATCLVEVVEKEDEAEGLRFKIKDILTGKFRAVWSITEKNVLEISAKHEQLKKILGKPEESYPGQKTILFKVLLVEILSDAMAWKKLELSARKEPHLYKNWQNQNDIEFLSDSVRGKYNNFRNDALFIALRIIGPLEN